MSLIQPQNNINTFSLDHSDFTDHSGQGLPILPGLDEMLPDPTEAISHQRWDLVEELVSYWECSGRSSKLGGST
jgi:hypothetical protein